MFGDRLKLSLALVVGSDKFSFASDDIEYVDVAVKIHGFEAEVGFIISSEDSTDTLFAQLSTNAVVKATLSIANGRAGLPDPAPDPLTLMGYVTHRRVREVVASDVSDLPILARRYVIRFSDPAQALWRQHQPIELYVQQSMQDVIDGHKVPEMSITYDWGQLSNALDVLCVGLGGDQDATFYDFVVWYCHENHGVMELDPGKGAYRLGKQKARGGQSVAIDEQTVDRIQLLGPEPVRYTTTVLNPWTEAAVPQKALTNDNAVTGVKVGAFAYTQISTHFDQAAEIETERLAPCEHGLEVFYKAFPQQLCAPGQVMTLGDNFSAKVYAANKQYRTVEVHLAARRWKERDSDIVSGTAECEIELRTVLELTSDPTPRLPPYRRPRYPVLVEGRVLSASGGDADRTFYAQESESDSLVRYRINIPLWNKIVVAPFVPMGLTGHFFFPAYKNQRVLCALDFDTARISSFLEWAGKLSKDTQGDQLVLGWNDTNETIISHQYEDDKPVLRVARRLEGDNQTITISEGDILMVVKEDPFTPKAAQTYDVTPNVEIAKTQTSSAVHGAVGDVTGAFESSMGESTAAVDGAKSDVDAALSASEAEIGGKIDAAQAELTAMAANAQGSGGAISGAVGGAKAEINAALEG